MLPRTSPTVICPLLVAYDERAQCNRFNCQREGRILENSVTNLARPQIVTEPGAVWLGAFPCQKRTA